jgi:hypothetical protein
LPTGLGRHQRLLDPVHLAQSTAEIEVHEGSGFGQRRNLLSVGFWVLVAQEVS